MHYRNTSGFIFTHDTLSVLKIHIQRQPKDIILPLFEQYIVLTIFFSVSYLVKCLGISLGVISALNRPKFEEYMFADV